MTMIRSLLAGTALVSLALPGAAAEALTPQAAIAIALEHHPALRAAAEGVAAAEADRDLARSGYRPRIDLGLDWTRSTNPVFVFASKLGQERFGAADFALDALNRPDPLSNAATHLVLRQSVWDAGRTGLHGAAAALGIEAEEASLSRTRDLVAFGALRAFWDAVLADAAFDVARAGAAAARANAELAARQVEAGLAVPSDRMSAEVRLAEVRALVIRAEQGTRVAQAGLRQALGLDEDREFVLVPDGPPPAASEQPAGAWVDEALASRQELIGLDRRLGQARIGERIARSRRLPEIGLGAQYEWNADTPFAADGDNWSVGASVRLPLYAGGETHARQARARADRARLESLREALAEQIRLEVRAAWADQRAATERLSVAESALGAADEALRIVRERYEEGMAVIVELLSAEAARTATRGEREAAIRDAALATAALEIAAGRRPTVAR